MFTIASGQTTGNATTGNASTGLRPRSCKRVACWIATGVGSEPSGSCCDESCLVEIARWECNCECGDNATRPAKSSRPPGDIAPDVKSEIQPCAHHYNKTRDRYGTILDNLGCICKILMSLNIRPCCVIPDHPPVQSSRSKASVTSESSGEDDIKICTRALCHSSTAIQTQEEDGWSKGEYCSDTPVELAMTASQAEDDDRSKEGCFSGTSHIAIAQVPQNIISICGKKSACSGRSNNLVQEGSACLKKSCCSLLSAESTAEIRQPRTGDCSKKSCCGGATDFVLDDSQAARSSGLGGSSGDAVKQVCMTIQSKANDFSKKTCCAGEADTRCSPSDKLSRKIESPSSDNIEALTATSAAGVESGNANSDLEQGISETEHLVLSVQGMTCTGCEKKLYRSLDSIPAVSNLKTSLVLAQAEFDLSRSSHSHSASFVTTLEKMTGFTFTVLTQPGENLELILNGNIQELGRHEDVPHGVVDVSSIDNNTIRVTYSPKVIGARELLSTPFFRSVKLPPVAPRPIIVSGRAHVRMAFLRTLVSSLLTIPVLILAWAPLPAHEIIYGAISLGLATIVQTVIAGPFYISAFKALVFARMIEMDLLIVLSTSTAYVYSLFAFAYLATGQPLSVGEFFETSTLLVTLIMVGRTVSAFARHKAIESISIETLQTPTALLMDPKTQDERETDARLLQYGDVFKVLPESSIVTDGVVITGLTEVDESMITGEATRVCKKPGSLVLAGSMNYSGTLVIRLTHLPGENTITTIGAMVDEAKSSKPRIQEIADRVAGYFVPVILILTVLVFAIWVSVGIVVRHEGASTACITAMTYAISALIIACPCAIGLAVPMVVVIAGGVGARHGLIFRSAETLEISRRISHVVFDKTGTLTNGEFSVVVEEDLGEDYDTVVRMILGLTINGKHPVSIAIANHLKAAGIQAVQVDNLVSVPGSGVEATADGKIVRAGSPHWLGVGNTPVVREILLQGLTTFCVLVDGDFVAAFGLEDGLRLDAVEAINQLRKRSVEISIISGDHEEAVQSVARQLAIPETNVRSRCSPGDKQNYIKEALTRKNGVVLFCGDGTNDAVALAQASVGIHMNEGTDIAQSAADAVLMRPSLKGILILMDLSKAYYRRVVFNFTWAFVYNLFATLLAAGAFPRARISPQFAGLGEIVSVLPVIAVAMQLRWIRF